MFYGWYIVAACLFLIILDGLLLYSFGVFLPFLKTEFAETSAGISSIYAVRSVVLAFSLVAAGKLVDLYDPRAVIFGGGMIAALGLLLAGFADSLWQLHITYGVLIGLGDGVLYITCVAVVSRWFTRKRAMVIGIVTTGIPLSGFIIPPLTEWLITDFGVKDAFIYLAGIYTIVLMMSFVLRGYPSDMGLVPYGESTRKDAPNSDAESSRRAHEGDWKAMDAFRTPVFWLMYAMFGLGFMTFLIVVLYTFSYAIENGISTETAAFALGCVGIGSIVGRLTLSGFLAEVLRSKWVLFICFIAQGTSIFLILLMPTTWGFYLFGLSFGFFYSGWVPIFPNLLGNFFGLKEMGTIYGFFGTSFCVAAVAAPLLTGFIHKHMGTYSTAFFCAIIFCYIATIASVFVYPPKKRSGSGAVTPRPA